MEKRTQSIPPNEKKLLTFTALSKNAGSDYGLSSEKASLLQQVRGMTWHSQNAMSRISSRRVGISIRRGDKYPFSEWMAL